MENETIIRPPQFVDVRVSARISPTTKQRLRARGVGAERFIDHLKRLLFGPPRGMAGSFTDFWENEILDHLFSAATYTAPATIHFWASTTSPGDTGGSKTEPSGNGYTRAAVTNNATNFPAASGGAKANGTAIVWPEATGSWGSISHLGGSDAGAAGNNLFHGDITGGAVAIAANQILRIPIGDFDVTLD